MGVGNNSTRQRININDMKKLLKEYSFTNDMEYYDMIVMSVINGQRTQAKNQFDEMPKPNKTEFVMHILTLLVEGDSPPLDLFDIKWFINEL